VIISANSITMLFIAYIVIMKIRNRNSQSINELNP